jgi:uncharacterized membrane protein YccC
MRGRIVFIVIAAIVVAALAALNWPEVTADAPLGLVMLTLIGIVLAVFLVSSAIQESRYLLDHRRHSRALQAQRELAEKAEASRFTDLRQQSDVQLRELRAQIDRMHQAVNGRLAQIESRLPASRTEHVEVVKQEPADVPPHQHVPL